MTRIAVVLDDKGWTLRSGCAQGADTAFERGSTRTQLFLPWPWFEGRADSACCLTRPQPEAFEIAERFHPVWDRLSRGTKALHARNVHQVLGPDVLSPTLSRFVICWTRGGRGGASQATRIANHYGIPVFDLARAVDLGRVSAIV